MANITPHKLLFIIILLVSPLLATSQAITLLIEQGDKYAEINDHPRAIEVYKAVLKEDENNIAAQYKIAESYRAILDYETAEGYYLKVKRRNDGRFLLSGYYYALMRKLNGDYQEALESFEEFMALLKERDQHEDERFRQYYEQARIEREGALIALNEISNAQPEHKFEILPDPVNSELMDSAPSIYSNDSTIVISSGRGRGRGTGPFGEAWNNLYRFTKVDGEWKELKTRDGFDIMNDNFEDAAGMFNHARNKFYFTRCEPNGNAINCFVYVSTLTGGEWSEPQQLNSNINSRGSNSRQPCITYSGDSLFFCSDRPGGVGSYDIYLSTKYGDENWGPAQHLGTQINTPFTESSPFYDHVDQTLFFSSDGHRGFGGFDIYLADGTTFEKAEIYNVGLPYNSNKDDLFFFLGQHRGYISSNRDGGAGKMDIYTFEVRTEKEIITEIETEQSIAGRNSLFSDDYDFDSDNDEMLSEIISHLMASNVSNIEMALTSEQLSFYNSLSRDDQERIDRIVGARVRNLSQDDIQAIRDEDEFFYSHMRSDDKRHVDNLVSAYVREDGLGLSVSVEKGEQDFYQNLSVEDKEKVDMIIATRMVQAHEYHYPTETYDQLDEQSRRSVDQLSYKVVSEKKNLENMSLTFDENLFLRNNRDQPEVINNSIKEKIYNLAEDPKYELKEEDRIFYQNLDSRQLQALENIASTIILHDVDKLGDEIAKEDLAVYNSFSPGQKQQLDKILTKIINNTMKADLYIGEVNFQKSEIAQAKLNRDIEAAFSYLKTTKQPLFDELSDKNHRAIERFIAVSNPWVKSPDNIYIPETEVSEPDTYVDRGPIIADVRSGVTSKYGNTVASNRQAGNQQQGTPGANPAISSTELSLYQNLTQAEKAAINRSVAASLVTTAYRENPSLPVADNAFQAELSAHHKSYVQVLARQLSGEPLTSTEKALLTSAQSYYAQLSGDEKATWSRLIAKEALKENRNGNDYNLSQEDQAVLASLTTAQKSAVNNIQDFLTDVQALIVSDNAIPGTVQLNENTIANIPAGVVSNFSQLNVNGTIVNATNESPVGGVALHLVSNNGVVIEEVITKPDGSFLFTSIPNTDYSIEIIDPAGIYDNTYLKGLSMKGTGPAPVNTNNPGDPITSEDIAYYGSLDVTKKRAIDLKMAAEILTETYNKSPRLVLTDQAFFNTLSEKEKGYISILARDVTGEPIQESEYLLKATADSYYAHLIPVEQPYWSRLIAKEALKAYRNGNEFTVSDEVKSLMDGLSYAEKNTYDRIRQSRSLNEPLFSDQLNADPALLAKIPAEATAGSQAKILNGQVAEVKTDTPSPDQSLALLNTDNIPLSTSRTDTQGQFQFDNVNQGEYKLNNSNSNSDNLYVNQLTLSDQQGQVLLSSSEPGSQTAGLESSDISFYQNLNEATRNAINRSIAIELLNEAYANDPSLVAKDEQFANSMSETQKSYLDAITQDLQGRSLSKAQQEDLAVAYSYYRQLPQAERASMGRLITQQTFADQKTGNTIQLSSSDEQMIAGLSSYEKGVYARIKEARKNSSPIVDQSILIGGPKGTLLEVPVLAAATGDQVEVSGRLITLNSGSPVGSVSLTLTDAGGKVISRTTTNAVGQFEFDRANPGPLYVTLSNPENLSSKEPVYVGDLDITEVATQNILAVNEGSRDISPAQLSSQTIATYQGLPRADQKTIDRIIAFDYLTEAYQRDPSLRKADQDAFRALDNEAQRFLKILAMDLKGEELSKAEQDFLSSAFTYYYNVAPGKKATLNRIVADMVFSENAQGKNYRMSSADVAFKNRMSASVNGALENIKTFRYNNERILSEDLEVESHDLGVRPVVLDIPGFTNQQYSRLNITGRLIDTGSGSPVSTKALRVVDSNGNMIARTFTGTDGHFKFNEIRAGDYKVELEEGYSARTQNASYFVKDLEITGTQGSRYAYQESFNIHFDFNAAEIRPEARQALFDVVELADRQELFIELRAHTDAIGNDRYNDQLSGKRGIAAMDFLKRYGVPDDHMTLLSYGKNDPVASNSDEYGRQFNRRVEIILKSKSPISYAPPSVYLIRPKATLYSIAKNFNLTVEEIMRLNGLSDPGLNAYKPIRILNPMNYKPNLDMLVELNTSVSTSNNFKYTVKRGETVTSIAEKFNLPEELILEMNGLRSLSLDQGQTLNIYVRF